MLFRDRRRAGSFGAEAARYDRSRPSYPSALIDDLMALKPAAVLDVGCGTGRAGLLVQERGGVVLGVEADPRMAAFATSKGLEVEVAAFEDWDSRGRRFDLLTCGQAWHWIDPVRGALQAARVLLPGGHLALFWNEGNYEPEVLQMLAPVYSQHAPQLAAGFMSTRRDAVEERVGLAALAADGELGAPEVRTYDWVEQHSTEQWVDQLGTHSDHATLPAEQRDALLGAVGAAIDATGGSILLRYRTILLLSARA